MKRPSIGHMFPQLITHVLQLPQNGTQKNRASLCKFKVEHGQLASAHVVPTPGQCTCL